MTQIMWIQIVSILSILFQFFLPQIAFRNVLLNCGPWRLVLFLFDPIQSRSDQNDFSFQRTYPFDQVLLCESEAIELLQVMIFEVKLLPKAEWGRFYIFITLDGLFYETPWIY